MPSKEVLDNLLAHNECVEILQNYAGGKVTLIDFSLSKFKRQMGYLGECYKLSISYHENNPEVLEKIEFFVKAIPTDNINQSTFVKEMGVFRKEVLVYKNLIAPFLKLSSKAFAPRVFLSDPEKYLVLENMFLNGYRISKSNYLNLEQCKSIMKTLARFHGATMIYEELQTKKIGKRYTLSDTFKEALVESTFSFTKGHPRYNWCISTTKSVTDLISLVIEDRREKSKLNNTRVNGEMIGNKFSDIMFTQMPKFLQPSKQFRNVCTHDDLWCNNIMFDDEGNSILVDFQLTRYSPPSFDVLLCLFLNLDRKLYNEHRDNLLEIYYDTLSKELQLHQLQAEQIFPLIEFHESIEYYTLPALTEAVMYGTNVYIEGQLQQRILSDVEVFQEFMSINRSKYIVAEYKENEMYRQRINHVLIPLVDYLVNNCVQI